MCLPTSQTRSPLPPPCNRPVGAGLVPARLPPCRASPIPKPQPFRRGRPCDCPPPKRSSTPFPPQPSCRGRPCACPEDPFPARLLLYPNLTILVPETTAPIEAQQYDTAPVSVIYWLFGGLKIPSLTSSPALQPRSSRNQGDKGSLTPCLNTICGSKIRLTCAFTQGRVQFPDSVLRGPSWTKRCSSRPFACLRG